MLRKICHWVSEIFPYIPLLNWVTGLFHYFRRQSFLGTFLYQMINNHYPSYANNFLSFKSSVYSLTIKFRPSDFYTPFPRSTFFQNPFFVRSPTLWDSLLLKIRHDTSLFTFKTLFFHILFTKQSVCNCHVHIRVPNPFYPPVYR